MREEAGERRTDRGAMRDEGLRGGRRLEGGV